MGVGPAADSVHAVAGVVAPVVPLSTTLTNVSIGVTAVLVMVHSTTPPGGTTTRAPVTTPPWQIHVPGVNPAGPVSDRSYEPENTDTAFDPARRRRVAVAGHGP